MVEVASLTTKVDRLITDVEDHGEKLDALRHQATKVTAWIAAAGVGLTILIAFIGYVLSDKGNEMLRSINQLQHPPATSAPASPKGE